MTAAPIYLDNASSSWPKPPSVAAAMTDLLSQGMATPGRGGYDLSRRSARIVERLRRRLARDLGAPEPERIILTFGATEALNTAILGLFENVHAGARKHVVCTVLDHNSVRRPLEYLAQRGVIDLTRAGVDAHGFLDPDEVAGLVNDRTALVVVPAASNVTGTIQPVAAIGRRLHALNTAALFLVDACQTAGLIPINVHHSCVDLLACSGHKGLLGPTGIGVLYVGSRAYTPGNPESPLRPTRFGGTGGQSDRAAMPEELPTRFEPGTPNTLAAAGLLAALEDSERPTPETALRHERELLARAIGALREIRGVRVVAPAKPEEALGIFTFVVDGSDPQEIASALDASFGIAVRAGLHCAPGAHEALGTLAGGGAVRVSPGTYTTTDEIDRFARAVSDLAGAG